MKLEAKSRLQATKVVAGYDPDASTAQQGIAAAKEEIKEGWLEKEDVKGWTLKSISTHLEQSIGASPKYTEAYVKYACNHFKLPVPKN